MNPFAAAFTLARLRLLQGNQHTAHVFQEGLQARVSQVLRVILAKQHDGQFFFQFLTVSDSIDLLNV
ncbi:hypothetical protein [Pseudomonas fluorescens]|uniref:hypothetical protein n=1 Tax=Pseudomonas fluorescens TaxID=294 RepID=UPI00130EA26F|nr:hypothetical protein [Pseudomonas fluorescens]